MADFVPGAALAQAFYAEVVGPALADIVHSAALLGTGSDVLGFDTSRSTDHGWGPRLHVFVDEVLLLDRRYAPYSKWLGSAFSRLAIAGTLGPALAAALAAATFADREAALVEAFQIGARHHNGAGVTRPVAADVSPFHGRPFRVLGSGRFVDVCLAEVADPWLRGLPLVGSVDQFVDSTDVLESAGGARRLASWYETATRP